MLGPADRPKRLLRRGLPGVDGGHARGRPAAPVPAQRLTTSPLIQLKEKSTCVSLSCTPPARLESRTVRTRRSWRQDRLRRASIDSLTAGDPVTAEQMGALFGC